MTQQNRRNDKSLNSGERHVQPSLNLVSKKIQWRYKQVLPYVKEGDTVLDIGCGVGYGCKILSAKAQKVIGIDDSAEAINYAKKYYLSPNIEYKCQDVFEINDQYDVIVALELIEHIKDTKKLFKKFEQWTKRYLIFTVPHDSIKLKKNSKWHWKHFSEKEIKEYLKDINFKIKQLELVKFGHGLAIFCVAKKEN